MNMIDSSTTVDMVYLDFSKAFNKGDHGIVLHKLREYLGSLAIWVYGSISSYLIVIGLILSGCLVELARTVHF